MSLPGPTPLQSFLGGVTLAFPVQALLSLNNSRLGISGFINGAVRGDLEDAMSVLGLVLGGVAVAVIEGGKPALGYSAPLPLMLSGLLVGAGTKMSNGCTSGHMICGLSQLSIRSIAATATFCATASLTTLVVNGTLAPIPGDPSLGAHSSALLAGSIAAFASTVTAPRMISGDHARRAVAFCSAFGFALALRLSNLTDSRRVLGFLLTPAHKAFDSSLVYMAMAALPLTTLLYHMGKVRVPTKGKVDGKLLAGAALFGVGWGIEGICPGPGLINFGWALATGVDVKPFATWLAGVVVGGFLVPS